MLDFHAAPIPSQRGRSGELPCTRHASGNLAPARLHAAADHPRGAPPRHVLPAHRLCASDGAHLVPRRRMRGARGGERAQAARALPSVAVRDSGRRHRQDGRGAAAACAHPRVDGIHEQRERAGGCALAPRSYSRAAIRAHLRRPLVAPARRHEPRGHPLDPPHHVQLRARRAGHLPFLQPGALHAPSSPDEPPRRQSACVSRPSAHGPELGHAPNQGHQGGAACRFDRRGAER
mmetsp:Transcript_3251/g.9348  ORF Transcript_3251/g.9348 Transcript_3251/m.9348 type:complete len:234 (-) Transcript_3251:659-1360(-)